MVVNTIRPRGEMLKKHIVTVAARLFYEEGINVVGVDRIASAADVTKRTLYRYFPSKDILIAASLRQNLGLVFPTEGSPTERILGAFKAMEDFMVRSSFRGCPYINAAAELSNRKHPARAIVVELTARRREWFVNRATEAGLGEPALVGEQMDILFDGAIANAAKRGVLLPLRAARAAVQTLLERSESVAASTTRIERPFAWKDPSRAESRRRSIRPTSPRSNNFQRDVNG